MVEHVSHKYASKGSSPFPGNGVAEWLKAVSVKPFFLVRGFKSHSHHIRNRSDATIRHSIILSVKLFCLFFFYFVLYIRVFEICYIMLFFLLSYIRKAMIENMFHTIRLNLLEHLFFQKILKIAIVGPYLEISADFENENNTESNNELQDTILNYKIPEWKFLPPNPNETEEERNERYQKVLDKLDAAVKENNFSQEEVEQCACTGNECAFFEMINRISQQHIYPKSKAKCYRFNKTVDIPMRLIGTTTTTDGIECSIFSPYTRQKENPNKTKEEVPEAEIVKKHDKE